MAENKKIAFEDALQRLDELAAMLENGKAPLDESLKIFEEGVKLVRECKKQLDEAEQKVKLLVENRDGTVDEKDFDTEDKQ